MLCKSVYDKFRYVNWPGPLMKYTIQRKTILIPPEVCKEIVSDDMIMTSINAPALHKFCESLDLVNGKFLKVDWAAPTDCSQIVETLMCIVPSNAFILLKMSEKIRAALMNFHNEEKPDKFDPSVPHYLYVMPYERLHKIFEYRIFIKDLRIVLIAPRYQCMITDVTTDIVRFVKVFLFEHITQQMGVTDLIIDLYCDVDEDICSSILLLDMQPLPTAESAFEDLCVLGAAALKERLKPDAVLDPLFVNPTIERISAVGRATTNNTYPSELTSGMISGTHTEIIELVRQATRKTEIPELVSLRS
ncbi:Hypothetical protein GLP15_1394 [Giardia lamblia P15]|uniref:Uncharacterized protein n=1 Tax=Giardia intestinalis (strain P15) TaxID=658858 RepID=E1EZ93_GIAIA|nr:Hypothetical protein GLP15_1394 [Giardia lamblia P15]